MDLGHGVTARLIGVDPDAVNVHGDRIYPDDVPEYVGAIVRFEGGDIGACEGVVFWWQRPDEPNPQPLWTLNSLDPLDVHPSVQCRQHPAAHHGWVRNGRWEPC